MEYSSRNYLGGLQLLTVVGGNVLLRLKLFAGSSSLIQACYKAGYDPMKLTRPLLQYGWWLVLLPLAWMWVMSMGERYDRQWASRRLPKVSGVVLLIVLVVIFAVGVVARR